MTLEELEQERAALFAELDTLDPDVPLAEEYKRRIADLAKHEIAAGIRPPLTPFELAMAEYLQELVALSDRDLPPGLETRLAGEQIEVLSRGEVIGSVSRQALALRAAQIAAERN